MIKKKEEQEPYYLSGMKRWRTKDYISGWILKFFNYEGKKIEVDKIKETLQNKDISFYLFRRKDAWDRSESSMIKIIDEEVINSRPLIKEMIEKHIEKYPFNELDKNEIVDTISDVIKERLFGDK